MPRIVAHLAVWAPFGYALAGNLQRGWVAVTDNGAIAVRSWDVLTAQGPLVGQATRLAKGVFDAGPLEYWLLALPVRLDPQHGVLWGAALWCMLAGSLAIEAAWSAAGRYGGLVTAGFIVGLIAWIPAIAQDPCWNPWLGIMYLTVALAAAWAVMSGHRGWGPMLVISASIAAQAHLMYAIAAAAAVVLALIAGLVDTIRSRNGLRGYRWLITGLVAGLAAWAAPLVQQFTHRRGNLSLLLGGTGKPRPGAGLSFGMKALSAAILPPAYWWRPLRSIRDLGSVVHRSAVSGWIGLGIMAAVLVIAIAVLRSRRAAMLAGLSVLLSAAVISTFASVPASSLTRNTGALGSLRYLLTPLYPAGVLAWLAALSVFVLLARQAGVRVWDRTTARQGTPGGCGVAARAAAGLAGKAAMARGVISVALVLIVAFACFRAVTRANGALRPESTLMEDVTRASARMPDDLRGRPMALVVEAPDNPERRQLTFGLVYALRTLGYRAEIGSDWAVELGSQYTYRDEPMPLVTVTMRGSGLSVDVTHQVPIARIRKAARARAYS